MTENWLLEKVMFFSFSTLTCQNKRASSCTIGKSAKAKKPKFDILHFFLPIVRINSLPRCR